MPRRRPSHPAAQRPRHRFIRLALRLTAVLWASSWSALVIDTVQGDSWRIWVIGGVICLIVWSLAIWAWFQPRLGGLAMILAGLGAWNVLHSRAAMLGLSIPAISLGIGFLLHGIGHARRVRKARRVQVTEATTETAPTGQNPPDDTPPGEATDPNSVGV